MTALALTAISICATPSAAASIDARTLYAALVVLMGVAGAGSLGFIGVLLDRKPERP